MREIRTRKTPNTNTFQAVCFKKRFLENILKKSVEKPQKCSTKILFWLFQNKYHENTLNAVFIELQTYNLCYYSVKGLSCAFALFSLGTLFIPSSRIAFCMETSTEKKKILQTAQYTKTPSLASFWCFYCLLWAYYITLSISSSGPMVDFEQVHVSCDPCHFLNPFRTNVLLYFNPFLVNVLVLNHLKILESLSMFGSACCRIRASIKINGSICKEEH